MTTVNEGTRRTARSVANESRPRNATVASTAPPSKRAFVLSFDRRAPVADIVAAATLQGIDLVPDYVYWVRSDAERKARMGKREGVGVSQRNRTRRGAHATDPSRVERAHRPASAIAAASSRTKVDEAERLIVETALRVVGIERAIEVLRDALSRLDRLVDA